MMPAIVEFPTVVREALAQFGDLFANSNIAAGTIGKVTLRDARQANGGQAFGVASAILIESSLSFLGIGDLSVPSWGETLNTGRLEQKLWLILAPGTAIFLVVSVFNLVGEGLRDALDPKLRA